MSKATILIVDDEDRVRRSIVAILDEEGYRVLQARSGREALDLLDSEAVDVVFLDIAMPGMDGVETLERIAGREDAPQVVMASAHGNVEVAVRCTKLGAFDFLEKPLSLDRMLVVARNAVDKARLLRENRRLQLEAHLSRTVVGQSRAIRSLLDEVLRVAPTHARVLISGENGTGKELIARSIHEASDRARGPFVEVNCAAIPDDLIESELFGHVKGAFTGAERTRRGKFEQAHGGTLFLDEIGDMSLRTQAKVLRALQENRIQPVGSDETVDVDVRVVAASNRDLKKMIREGTFREDLFYRLCVVPLRIPPLRERLEDLPLLVHHYLSLFSRINQVEPKRLTAAAMARLVDYDWPGNVRELGNLIERLVIMVPSQVIDVADLPVDLLEATADRAAADENDVTAAADNDDPLPLRDARERWERRYILRQLLRNQGNIKKTADDLGVERSNLHRKIRTYAIDVDALRQEAPARTS